MKAGTLPTVLDILREKGDAELSGLTIKFTEEREGMFV